MPEYKSIYNAVVSGRDLDLDGRKIVIPSFGSGDLSNSFPLLHSGEGKYDPIRTFLQNYWTQVPGSNPKVTYGKRIPDMTPYPWTVNTTPAIFSEADDFHQFGKWTQRLLVRSDFGESVFDPSLLDLPLILDVRKMTEMDHGTGWFSKGAYGGGTTFPISDNVIAAGDHLDSAITNIYVDSTFFIDRPSVQKLEALDSDSKGRGPSPFVEITPSYNFYLCEYEEKIDAELSDHWLPNAYNITSINDRFNLYPGSQICFKNGKPTNEPGCDETVHLDAETVPGYSPRQKFIYPYTYKGLTFYNLNKYLTEWPTAMTENPLPPQVLDTPMEQDRYRLYPPSEREFYRSVKDNIDKFPMHINVSFSTTPKTGFVNILNQADFFNSLAKNIFYAHQATSLQDVEADLAAGGFGGDLEFAIGLVTQSYDDLLFSKGKTWTTDQALGKNTEISEWPENTEPVRTKLQYFNLSHWLKEMMNAEATGGLIDVDAFKEFIYPYANDWSIATGNSFKHFTWFSPLPKLSIFEKEGDDGKNKLLQSLLFTIAKIEINNYAKEHMRSYEQILKGEPAYNETVMYELVKLDKQLNKIDTIFLPQTTGIIEYFDTQVRYGKDYIYQIYAHQLVVGTKYKYNAINEEGAGLSPNDDSFGTRTFELEVEYEPDLKIYRVPYYNTEDYAWKRPAKVTDSPPLPPEVTFYPLKGAKNKIILAMNISIGQQKMEPVPLSEQDEPVLDYRIRRKGALYKYDKRPDAPGWEIFQATMQDLPDYLPAGPDELTYSADDMVGTFEVYRLDKKPGFYTDFSPLSKTLIAEMDSREQTAFVDKTIQPNRKYYYTCRVRDVHGNLSNPTPVYEVELIDSGLGVYPSIKTVELTGLEKAKTNPTKPFKRFLLIRPNYIQDLVPHRTTVWTAGTPTDEPIEMVFDNAELASDAIKIGAAESSVFTRKFKARITSRRTGKKIDFNFRVKTTGKKLQAPSTMKEKC